MSKDDIQEENRGYRKLGTITKRIRLSARKKGLLHVVFIAIKVAFGFMVNFFGCYLIYKPFKSKRVFIFQRKSYPYFYHWYNSAWRNERTIEIPIITDIVKKYHGKRILEVGNVLSHYIPINHDVLDKYEEGKGVINQDIVDFAPSQKYDLIVSISTLEHVGWDEHPRDPMKIMIAINHLEQLLTENGKMFVTLPIGYNKVLDDLLTKGEIPLSQIHYFKRTTKSNDWIETLEDGALSKKYGSPYISANGLVIGTFKKR